MKNVLQPDLFLSSESERQVTGASNLDSNLEPHGQLLTLPYLITNSGLSEANTGLETNMESVASMASRKCFRVLLVFSRQRKGLSKAADHACLTSQLLVGAKRAGRLGVLQVGWIRGTRRAPEVT